MTDGIHIHRRTAVSSLLALAAAGAGFPVGAQTGKSALNLAMVAEPPTLDIQSTPADLVCIIMQHVYEPLFTFDAQGALVPMLAESMPKISADDACTTRIALPVVSSTVHAASKTPTAPTNPRCWMSIPTTNSASDRGCRRSWPKSSNRYSASRRSFLPPASAGNKTWRAICLGRF